MLPRGNAALALATLIAFALAAEPVSAIWGAPAYAPRRRAKCHRTDLHRCPKRGVPPRPAGPAPGTGTSDFGPVTGGGTLAPVAPVAPSPTTPPTGGSGAGEAPGAPVPAHLQVTAEDSKAFRFVLSRPSVPAGKVIIEFVNRGQDEHNLTALELSEGNQAGSLPNTAPGAHPAISVEMRQGSYTLFCSLPGHEEKGMKATLQVN